MDFQWVHGTLWGALCTHPWVSGRTPSVSRNEMRIKNLTRESNKVGEAFSTNATKVGSVKPVGEKGKGTKIGGEGRTQLGKTRSRLTKSKADSGPAWRENNKDEKSSRREESEAGRTNPVRGKSVWDLGAGERESSRAGQAK